MSATSDYLIEIVEKIERKYQQDFYAIMDFIVENPICDEEIVITNAETAARHNLLYKRGFIYLYKVKEEFQKTIEFLESLGYTLMEQKKTSARLCLAGQEIIIERKKQ